MKTIIFNPAATKDFDALPASVQQQVSDTLDTYAITGRGDITRLAGREGFRLRVGRYRVIFDEDRTTIVAIYIGKRETATYLRH
jgi:mRNA interferase RelE/StbE